MCVGGGGWGGGIIKQLSRLGGFRYLSYWAWRLHISLGCAVSDKSFRYLRTQHFWQAAAYTDIITDRVKIRVNTDIDIEY